MKESRPEKPHPYDIAHKTLRKDEQVLWEGAPAHRLFVHRSDIIIRLCIMLLVCTALVFQLISGEDTVTSAVLLIMALLLTALPFAVMARKLRRSYYILAENRVILVMDNEVTTWSYDSLKYLEVTDRQLGVYTVYIEYAELYFAGYYRGVRHYHVATWDYERHPRGALVNLREEDKDRVYNIIRSRMFGKETT